MRTLALTLTALTLAGAAAPALADDDWRDRRSVSRGEVRQSYNRLLAERRDWQAAQRWGDRRDVREEGREYERARREWHQDRLDLIRREAREQRRGWDGRGGRFDDRRRPVYGYGDPRYGYGDPRFGYNNAGWRPEADYRYSPAYRSRFMGINEPVFRGYDNRYYCRRSDGTTGLILGAIGGGVLGNVIAPGGQQTLATILGGGLGAALGRSIDRNRVTCR